MMASLVVIAAYLVVLALIVFPPAALQSEDDFDDVGRRPWWRNVRFWASFVIVAQIVVYAVWG